MYVGDKMGTNKPPVVEFIRREVIKQRTTQRRSYKVISVIIKRKFDKCYSIKTLRRWVKRFQKENWNFRDASRRPHTIHIKITSEIKREVVEIRKATGWEAWKIKQILRQNPVSISESSIKQIIRDFGLSRGSKMEGKRLKWVRWQREHPDSLWQLDHTEEDMEGWVIGVIDDCSRYCLGLRTVESVTTEIVTEFLDELIEINGKPREILTDNGSPYGGKGDTINEFDKWCERRGIIHIRAGIKRPTTLGKIERFFGTRQKELPYCHHDDEYFRMRYNTFRPHRSLFGKTPADMYFAFEKRL